MAEPDTDRTPTRSDGNDLSRPSSAEGHTVEEPGFVPPVPGAEWKCTGPESPRPVVPRLRFLPDRKKQVQIARFRNLVLVLTLAVLLFGLVVLFQAGSWSRSTGVSQSPAGNASDKLLAVGRDGETEYPSGRTTPRVSQGTGSERSPLQATATAVAGIDSAVQSACARWQRAEGLWRAATGVSVDVVEALAKVAAAQALVDSAGGDLREARSIAQSLVAIQENSGNMRLQLGELHSAHLAFLSELDSVGVSRRRQLQFIEEAFRSLQAGETADYYIKLENPAGAEQRRAELAMKRADRARLRVEQAARSLGLSLQ